MVSRKFLFIIILELGPRDVPSAAPAAFPEATAAHRGARHADPNARRLAAGATYRIRPPALRTVRCKHGLSSAAVPKPSEP